MMFDAILHGRKPTDLFKELVRLEPGLNNWDLASRFCDHFENLGVDAAQVIWNWERPGGRAGLSDEKVDDMLLGQLRAAGYSVSGAGK